MTAKIFTLEALEAKHGDSLLLHYGSPQKPRLIIIDGGPPSVFKNSLSPRLQAIKAARGAGRLEVRMLMVSHIDDDHIAGVLDLTKQLRAKQDADEEVDYDILTLWHNSFDDIVAQLGVQAQSAIQQLKLGKKDGADGAAIAASVPQGRTLRRDASALSLNVNSGFDELVTFQSKTASTVNIGEGLSFLVLGPRQAELDALEIEWGKKLKAHLAKKPKKKAKKKGAGAAIDPVGEGVEAVASEADLAAVAAEFLDDSIANLSSIVVLASCAGKTMLLTGDARGDHIISSLRDCKLLPKTGGHLHVDLLKMPHHGSARNMEVEFLKLVTADHYVFSADGKHDNPDIETFEMLFEARPKGGYTLWLTNDVKAATQFIKKKKPKSVKLMLRTDPARSVKIDLGQAITV